MVLRFLRHFDIEKLAICANGKTKMIAGELSSGAMPWNNLHYSEDRFPRGPAGCLKDLEGWLGGEAFLVIQATGFYDFDLQAMMCQHVDSGAAITVGATVASNAGYDRHLQPAGVYVMDAGVLGLINAVGYQDIKEQLLPKAIAGGMAVRCHTITGRVELIHGLEHYLEALRTAIPKAGRELPHGLKEVEAGVWVHPSAKVEGGVRFTGPAWVDREVRIGGGSVMLGPTVLGARSVVGANVILNRVVGMEGCCIGDYAEMSDMVVAPAGERMREVIEARRRGVEESRENAMREEAGRERMQMRADEGR